MLPQNFRFKSVGVGARRAQSLNARSSLGAVVLESLKVRMLAAAAAALTHSRRHRRLVTDDDESLDTNDLSLD